MENKTRQYLVVGILLFSAVLFVSGLGNVITGNAVAGSQIIELKQGETANVLGKEITLVKISTGSGDEIAMLTGDRFYKVLLEVSGMQGFIVTGKTKQINQLRIKFLDVKYPHTSEAKARFLVSKVAGSGIASGFVDFPYPFVKNGAYDFCIVLSNKYSEDEFFAAKKIAGSLKQNRMREPLIVAENRLNEVSCGRNKILIGKPCELQLMADSLMDSSCSSKLNPGEGYIEYLPTSNRPDSAYLVVTGYSNEDILKAAAVVAHQKDFYGAETNKVIVKGDYVNDYALKLEEIGTKIPINRLGEVKQVYY